MTGGPRSMKTETRLHELLRTIKCSTKLFGLEDIFSCFHNCRLKGHEMTIEKEPVNTGIGSYRFSIASSDRMELEIKQNTLRKLGRQFQK